MPDHLTRLLEDLRASGPVDLDATALAEAVWLAATLPGERDGSRTGPEEPAPPPPRTGPGPGHAQRGGPGGPGARPSGAAMHEQLSDSAGTVPGEPVAVTRGRALPQALELSRALRAYKRPWAAGLHTELDIERTIDGYARSGELIPAFRAAPERWFDLLLIVDRSLSMQVWKETISELEHVLDHLGAFRLLRTWGLTFEDARPVLHDHQGAVAGPDHVLSPQGRRLVLVVSDCAATGWYHAEVWKQLRTWAQSTPVAVLDPLPPKLWRRTALDLPGVTATQAVPGSGSTTLRFTMPLLIEESGDKDSPWIPVPVLSLSKHALGRWARTQMRGDPSGCDAVLVPPAGRVPRTTAGRPRPARLDPVQAFVRTASPQAAKLAVLCAPVGRIGLPLLQLVRRHLVPDATVADVAELLTSDLVSLWSQDDGTFVLTFRDGVREELKRLLPQHEAWRLYGVLDRHVVAGAGTGVPAVLHDPGGLQRLPAELRPFGRAALDVLHALEAEDGGAEGEDMESVVATATTLIAGGLDAEEILQALSASTMPAFADSVVVYLRDPLPSAADRPVGRFVLRRWHADRTDGGRHAREFDLGDFPETSEVHPGSELADVLLRAEPVFADASAAVALMQLLGTEHIVADGARTLLAPLRGRSRAIGVALFLRGLARAPFRPDDLLLAAQLASTTGIGIDQALLYSREARLADTLQRTMLPETLPETTGVRLATRYLPASHGVRVGGDWYDAIPLPGSRVALVIGDVMGHSMTSAAIMGQLRTALQTLAGLDLPPQEVLHHLDEQAQQLGTDTMATCLFAVYDPVSHRITLANAGHTPPILLYPGGRAEVLRIPPGAPVGVGGVDFEAVELDAPPGATLLLYTDGLVESRHRDVWNGMEQLRERLSAIGLAAQHLPALEPLCDEVLDLLHEGLREDDVALLAAQFEGLSPLDVAYWHLDPSFHTPSRARQLTAKALSRWGLEAIEEPVVLLVNELVTNAVRWSSRPVTLRLLRTNVLRCEVGDDVPQMPKMRRAQTFDLHGRGLQLVDRIAARWGSTRLSTGKIVWFEYPLPEDRPARPTGPTGE